MTAILAEPSLYTYQPEASAKVGEIATADMVNFQVFWKEFEFFSEFVELNKLQIIITQELIEAMQSLFPHSLAEQAIRRNASLLGRTAYAILLRFLTKYQKQPRLEFQDIGQNVTITPSLTRHEFVYKNEDIWIAWQDLIAQAVTRKGIISVFDLLCAVHSRSSVNREVQTLAVSSAEIGINQQISIIRLAENMLGQYADPFAYRDMCKRNVASKLQFSYEDSGHQPSRAIKKVLERTADDARQIVVRMNTSYHNPQAVESCKLTLTANFDKLAFRISDGQAVLKGFFTTLAKSSHEQKTALAIIAPLFRQHCVEAGFYPEESTVQVK